MSMGRVVVLFLFVGSILASCSKDKEDDTVNRDDFGRSYFNIQNRDFDGRSLPGSNSTSLEILSISGNSTVLAGGSNQINVSASEGATEVIVGVKGIGGYFTVPLAQNRNGEERGAMAGTMEANMQLLIGLLASENFEIAFAVSDGQGNFSPYQYLPVNIMEAGIGLLKVSLSWDQENDVDLHLVEPNGEHIYYGNRSSSNGGQLDLDSNAGCSIDNINNENIFYEDDASVTIPYGEYEVLVDLWSKCNITAETHYTIVVYYGSQVIATTQGSNPSSGTLMPEEESHNSNLRSVMKFNIDGPPADRNMTNRDIQSAPKVFKFDYDSNNKVFKNFSSEKE